MRSLDQFYRYIENQDAVEGNGSSPVRKAAKPVRGGAGRPSPRYVIRNGVTVQVPVSDTAPSLEPENASADFPAAEASSPSADPLPPATRADFQEVTDAANWRSLPAPVQRLALLSADLLPRAAPQDGERRQLIERLLNPLLTLEDTARLLGVCTATVRRYANKGMLPHHRTIGQQRRFLLAEVLALMESRNADAAAGSDAAPEAAP